MSAASSRFFRDGKYRYSSGKIPFIETPDVYPPKVSSQHLRRLRAQTGMAAHPETLFGSLQDPRSMFTLKWELPMRQASYSCPHARCGELVKQDPLDTPARNFRELAEVA